MRERFDAKHALKAPAHITLLMPFKKDEKFEKRLIPELKSFSDEQAPFEVNLKGFDCFEPRVIFVKIVDHTPIQSLYSNLRNQMIERLNFDSDKLNSDIHPHMTIATRDLKEKVFYDAWNEFETRELEDSFTADSITLLKHNGKFWDIYEKFDFSDS